MRKETRIDSLHMQALDIQEENLISPQVFIRADASVKIGSGHVMRCLALAGSLRKSGATVTFISHDLPGNLFDIIKQEGHALHVLPADSERLDWQQDADLTMAILASDSKPDWLVVDHYQLDAKWEKKVRSSVSRMMVIDDVADRPHDCDLILDQNYHSKPQGRYIAMILDASMKLFGPRFALLRPEFEAARKGLQPHDGEVKRILVFFGGSDSANMTAKAIQAVQQLARPDIALDVVVGAANPHAAEIRTLCDGKPNTTYYCQPSGLAELMAAADIALGAGGSTHWERCCLGLPSVVVTLADNQVPSTSALAEDGYVLYLGDAANVSVEQLYQGIAVMIYSPWMLKSFSRKCAELVDGLGAMRVANNLIGADIVLRRAVMDDCEPVYAWRNAEINRQYARDSKPFPMEKHRQWFARMLDDPDLVLLIGEVAGEPVGILRYDFDAELAEVSIYLVPGWHGRGYGARLLDEGQRWLGRYYPDLKIIQAEVLSANAASAASFLKAGFERYSERFRKQI